MKVGKWRNARAKRRGAIRDARARGPRAAGDGLEKLRKRTVRGQGGENLA